MSINDYSRNDVSKSSLKKELGSLQAKRRASKKVSVFDYSKRYMVRLADLAMWGNNVYIDETSWVCFEKLKRSYAVREPENNNLKGWWLPSSPDGDSSKPAVAICDFFKNKYLSGDWDMEAA